MFDGAKQNALGVQFIQRASLSAPMPASVLCGDAGVLAGRAVALQLAAEGAGRAVEQARHGMNAVALLLQAGEGDAVLRLELGVVPGARQHRWTLQVAGVALRV